MVLSTLRISAQRADISSVLTAHLIYTPLPSVTGTGEYSIPKYVLTLATICLFRSSPDVRSTSGVLVWAMERAACSQRGMSHAVSRRAAWTCFTALPRPYFFVHARSHSAHFSWGHHCPSVCSTSAAPAGDDVTLVIHHLRESAGARRSGSSLTQIKFVHPSLTKYVCFRQISSVGTARRSLLVLKPSNPSFTLLSSLPTDSARRRSPIGRRTIPP
ncbi:hypothetical protein EDB84DRAFT_1550901 [Lactarius hengduanensis]|nr:hypothetical protein EDB84DRAFT_1550901 [Lactarius hengduanensis]